eukprot:g3414.t1
MVQYRTKRKARVDVVDRAVKAVERERAENAKKILRAPPKNKDAFAHFAVDKRKSLRDEFDGFDEKLDAVIRASWSKLSKADREAYEEKAARDSKRYRQSMKIFKEAKKIRDAKLYDLVQDKLNELKERSKLDDERQKEERRRQLVKERDDKKERDILKRLEKLKDRDAEKRSREDRKRSEMWRKMRAGRYPIEDTELIGEPALASPLAKRPEPRCSLPLRGIDGEEKFEEVRRLTENVLMCWNFLRAFSESVLSLTPPTLDATCRALSYAKETVPLAAEVHMSLLRVVLDDPSLTSAIAAAAAGDGGKSEISADSATIMSTMPHDHHMSVVTWPQVLRCVLLVAAPLKIVGEGSLPRLLDALKQRPWHKMRLADKVELLRFLVCLCYRTRRIHRAVRGNCTKRRDLFAEKKRVEDEEKKKRRVALSAAKAEKRKKMEAKRRDAEKAEAMQKKSMSSWLAAGGDDEDEDTAGDAAVEEDPAKNKIGAKKMSKREAAIVAVAAAEGVDIVPMSSLTLPHVSILEVSDDSGSENSEEEFASVLSAVDDLGLSRQEKLRLRKIKLAKREEKRRRQARRGERRAERKEQMVKRKGVIDKRNRIIEQIADAKDSGDCDGLSRALEEASSAGLAGGTRRRQWCVRAVYEGRSVLETLREEREAVELIARVKREFNEKMDSCSVRARPLGFDSKFNAYWHFVSDKPLRVFVQHRDGGGFWPCFAAKELEALQSSLDKRGVRERALKSKINTLIEDAKRAAAARKSEEEDDDEEENAKIDDDAFVVDDDVEALFKNGKEWFAGTIVKVRDDETYDIEYADGDAERRVPKCRIRYPVSDPISWEYEGQPFLNCRVRRFFDGVASDGVVLAYAPALDDENPALWHVRHEEDGDEEDLEEDEVKEAIAAYSEDIVQDTENFLAYVNTKRKKDRRVHRGVSLPETVRDDMLRVGADVAVGLREWKSEWCSSTTSSASRKQSYAAWKRSLETATTLCEFKSLLLEIESEIHDCQDVQDRPESNEWKTRGHPLVGKKVRHFFESDEGGLGSLWESRDGTIVAWKADDDGDDDSKTLAVADDDNDDDDIDALFKISFEEKSDDGIDGSTAAADEREKAASTLEMDEADVKRDMKHYMTDAKVPTSPWLEQGPYVGERMRRFFNVHGTSDGVVTGYQPAAEGTKPLWHVKHDDGDEEDLEEFEVKWAVEYMKEDAKEGWITIDASDAYIGKRALRFSMEGKYKKKRPSEGVVIAAWLPLPGETDIQMPLWNFRHDDGTEEDLEQHEVEESIEAYEKAQDDANDLNENVHAYTNTLWPSLEKRERWLGQVREISTFSSAGLLTSCLKDHAGAFGVVEIEGSKYRSSGRRKAVRAMRSWYQCSSRLSESARSARAQKRAKNTGSKKGSR